MAQEATTIARPYAEAVFKLATEQSTLDAWSELLVFYAAVMRDPAMTGISMNPQLSRQRLTEFMLDLGEGRISDEGANFIRVLVENGRLDVLPEIAEIFETLKKQSEGTLEVELTSAFPVSDEEAEALASALKARLGREVTISSHQDPEIIGGVRIRAGDVVIDGSVQGQLQQLAKELGI
jgi:F-type H+-transporting ATPase subunit delta